LRSSWRGFPASARSSSASWDTERRSIDWDRIDAEYRSHGEQLLVDLADNLWNRGACPSVLDLVATLDDDNFALALRAMKIQRGWRGGAGR
jgi:hypothetical protein